MTEVAPEHVLRFWIFLRKGMSLVTAREEEEKIGPSADGFVDLPIGRWSFLLLVSIFLMKARATFEGGG